MQDIASIIDAAHVPRLICFDLDATAWEPEMYMLSSDPRVQQDGSVVDSSGEEVQLYDGFVETMRHLLEHSHFANCQLAVASRTYYSERADVCMNHLVVVGTTTLKDAIHHEEIYPADKKKHFKSLAKKSGAALTDMLFFDNEYRNCQSVEKLGVTCIHTPDGMTIEHFIAGLKTHAQRKSK